MCLSIDLRIFISWGLHNSCCRMSSLHGPSCGQPTAGEANEAASANRAGKAPTQGFKQSDADTHRESRDWAPDRQAEWSQVWEGGQIHIQNYVASCISHRSSSSSSSSTWTEPPSRSAVRCDPRVSLLVTGVGWDSLPLGSGDLTQRAKRVEAGGREVVRRRRRGGGRRRLWGEGSGGWGWGNVVGEGVRVKVWREGQGGGGEWMKKKKKQKQKNYRRHLSSRSRLVKTNYVNRGVEGSKNLCEAQINTLTKSCRSKRKQPWSPQLALNIQYNTDIYLIVIGHLGNSMFCFYLNAALSFADLKNLLFLFPPTNITCN